MKEKKEKVPQNNAELDKEVTQRNRLKDKKIDDAQDVTPKK